MSDYSDGSDTLTDMPIPMAILVNGGNDYTPCNDTEGADMAAWSNDGRRIDDSQWGPERCEGCDRECHWLGAGRLCRSCLDELDELLTDFERAKVEAQLMIAAQGAARAMGL